MFSVIASSRDKYTILKEVFGYHNFRPGQAEIIDALIEGHDVLAILPTGAGKSICYQIPALLREGVALIISPLISLMKDQVQNLLQADLPAAFINSSLSPDEYSSVMRRTNTGAFKILYIAPERLNHDHFMRLAEALPISLVVIDEAHCVSQWGHDFRPGYLRIAAFIHSLKRRPPVAAFTATATAQVKKDIIRSLELRAPFCITTGFDRPNLYFAIQKDADKTQVILRYLQKHRNQNRGTGISGIIYCSTRKNVEELCSTLVSQGFQATRYHAGLEDQERHTNQDDFISDRKPIMVATNAFGMGINKTNVRFVIHYNMPKNIESYYQEAGRAGRDGSNADCILLYSPKDVRTNEYLIKQSAAGNDNSDEELIAHNMNLLKHMTFYATATDCLRHRLLSYFNDTRAGGEAHYCGYCSNCQTRFEKTDITIEAQKIISCVIRLKQRGRQLGKVLVTQILRGSKSEKILSESFNMLSTYGIMKDSSERRCREIIDYLLLHGYLALSQGDFPVIETTPQSAEIVFEKKPLAMMLAKETPIVIPPPRQQKEEEVIYRELTLLEKLKKLRLKIAHEVPCPAFIIFPDVTLNAMSELLPLTRAAFLDLPGVGVVKAEKYADIFISCIEEHLRMVEEEDEDT